MNPIIIYNDNHWYSPISIDSTIDQFKQEMGKSNVFALGDNFDLANCKKSDVPMIIGLRQTAVTAMGWRWIDGNHSRTNLDNLIIRLTPSIIAVHGDFESWGSEKAIAYRSKPKGASALKRLFVKAYNEAYDYFNGKITDELLARVDQTAKAYNTKIVIMGHLHRALNGVTPNGVKVVVLPRGRNVIDLDSL